MPNSRIYSWESWFIFNLRKINIIQYCKSGLRIKEQSYLIKDSILQITHDYFFLEHNYAIIALYILERPFSWSTFRIHPSWPQSRVELKLLLLCFMSILLVCLGPPSILLFTLTTQVSRSTLPTSRPAKHQCSSKQHSYVISYSMYTDIHIHITFILLLVLFFTLLPFSWTSSNFSCRKEW